MLGLVGIRDHPFEEKVTVQGKHFSTNKYNFGASLEFGCAGEVNYFMKKNKWIGSPKGLQKRIMECGFSIVDVKKHNGALTFKTSQGGIVNWWETTKTVQFQGKPEEKKKLSEDLYLDCKENVKPIGGGEG